MNSPNQSIAAKTTPSGAIHTLSTGALEQQELKTEDFVLFRDFIHEKTGMFFAENKMYLVKIDWLIECRSLVSKVIKITFNMVSTIPAAMIQCFD
jgi:hypothetical protein